MNVFDKSLISVTADWIQPAYEKSRQFLRQGRL